jgi:hypothetical protein
MAENIKRRVAAARLAVAFVAAGTIAGATAWAQAGPPPTAHSSAYDAFYKPDSIKSKNIVNGSLLFQDFKAGEVVSGDAFFKYKKAETSFKKAVNNFKYDINGNLDAIKGELGAIKGELPAYIKMSDADARYIKMNDAIMGDGSVFTASKAFAANTLIGLLNVPNLVSVDALPGGDAVQITNIGGNDLTHSDCKTPAGGQSGGGTLKPGESLSCATGEHTDVMQLIGGSGGSEVVTLNFTKISGNITVQVLIGL